MNSTAGGSVRLAAAVTIPGSASRRPWAGRIWLSRWLRTSFEYVRLARPTDNAFAFFGTVIGAGLAGVPSISLNMVLMLAFSNALLSAASMVFNDWHDVVEDAVNRPDRPIPSGAVPRGRALVVGLLLALTGILGAAAAGPVFGLAALGVIGLSALYTLKLKSIPLAGNTTVGLLSAYPLWCWIALQGVQGRVYLGAAAAFFVAGVGREVVRTSIDAAGDKTRQLRTVATLWGSDFANRLGVALYFLGLGVAWVTASGTTFFWYQSALAVSAAVMLVAVLATARQSRVRCASRRLTTVARILTALLVSGTTTDLVLRGWWVP